MLILSTAFLMLLLPPSSSGLGHLVLSQETGVRFPVGVLVQDCVLDRLDRGGDAAVSARVA